MMLRDGEGEALRDFFADYHPARVAEVLEDLEPDEGDTIFTLLEPRKRADVMSYLDAASQERILDSLPTQDAADLLRLMPHDDRADLVNRIAEDHAEEILKRMAHAEREDIRRLLSYEDGTAGAVMTTDYVALPPQITVREALDQVRREAPDRETIDRNYVVDAHRKLIGIVSLPSLVRVKPSVRVEDIMETDLITALVDEDQESVAHKIQDYDLIAIPVVDANQMLVGIVTHDDAMDILRQEQTKDMLSFGGVAAGRETESSPYWQGRVLVAVKGRVGWLLLLFLGGFVTGFVVESFEWVEDEFPGIAFDAFIPLLIGTGGNAGSQTVGTVIRGIALGEIEQRDFFRVLGREMLTGLLLGTLLGAFGFVFATFLRGNPAEFGLVIALAVLGICVWANSVGAVVPMLASRFGIDPAAVSAPLISTFVDTTGLIIFYSITILVLLKLFG